MPDFPSLAAAIAEELGRTLRGVDPAQIDALLSALDAAPRVFLAGAGRSALAIRGCAMRLMHMGLDAHVVGETTTPGIAAGDLLLIGSGSGRTASLVAAATRAKSLGARVALVTIDRDSPIGQLADVVVTIPAPSPKAANPAVASSVQPMGSLFEQTLFVLLDTVIVMLMARRNLTSEVMFQRHANLE